MRHSNSVTRLFLVFGAALFALVCSHPISAQATNTFANTGNAGAGTTNPQGKLVVSSTNGPGANTGDLILENPTAYANGNTRTSAISFKTNNPDSLLGYESASIRALMTPSTGITSPQALLQFWTASNTQGLMERMRITEDGNVGIGTASPSWTLHTRSGLYGVGFSNSDFALGAIGTVFNIAYGASTGNTYTSLQTTIAGGTVPGNTVLQKDGGNVGIGTTSPTTSLSVNGSVALQTGSTARGTMRADTAGNMVVNSTGNGGLYLNFDSGAGGIMLGNGASGVTGIIDSSGKVGIGTTSPTTSLSVNGSVALQTGSVARGTMRADAAGNMVANSTGNGALYLNFDSGAGGILFGNGASGVTGVIDSSGKVGIGTTNPSSKLQVVGGDLGIDGNQNLWLSASKDTGINENPSTGVINFVVPGNSSTRGFNFLYGSNSRLSIDGATGNVTASGTIEAGNIKAKYQDVAEWVPASEQLSAGTVVVLDSTKSNQVTSSSTSYDTRVAGVISEKPGIALGEKSEGKVLVATTGRVRVKVDATKGPIHIGDLLVTSDIPGVAMKSEAVNLGGVQFHRPGTLIGKALEPLEKGKGEILVLLSLQ